MVLPVNFEIEEHKKLVMIGESGSGKTELALRICCQLRDHSDATVYMLDMDQTKPMFRSRDVADFLREKVCCSQSRSNSWMPLWFPTV